MPRHPTSDTETAVRLRAYRARRRRGLVLVTIRAEVPSEREAEFRARVAQVEKEMSGD